MKNCTIYTLLFILFSSCTHSITRSYQVQKNDNTNCNIEIRKNIQPSDSLKKVGEIRLGDTGFSTACSEERAIEILKREGCSLQADIINITAESRPDIWSTCYRCRAEFYKYTKQPAIKTQSEETYNTDNINKRVSNDRKNNAGFIIGAIIAGVIMGFVIYQLPK